MASAGSVGRSGPPRRGEVQARVKRRLETFAALGRGRLVLNTSNRDEHTLPTALAPPTDPACHIPRLVLRVENTGKVRQVQKCWAKRTELFGFLQPPQPPAVFPVSTRQTLPLVRVRSLLAVRKSDSEEWSFEGVRRKVLQQGKKFEEIELGVGCFWAGKNSQPLATGSPLFFSNAREALAQLNVEPQQQSTSGYSLF